MKAAEALRRRSMLLFAAVSAALVIVFLANICIGSVRIPLSDIRDAVAGRMDENATNRLILMRVRLPRAVASVAAGASLAIAGFLMQTFFSNPIVEPYVLGISSGSVLFVALVTMGGFTFGIRRITPMVVFAGAFAGAMSVLCLVLIASRKTDGVVTLLVVGLMFGYICGAGTSIMSAFAERERLANFTMWTMGSFASFGWDQVRVEYIITIPALAGAFLLSKALNALALGDRYAQSMGINVRAARTVLLLIAGVLTAAVTAFAGPVSFIGMAVPHICRTILKTANSRILLPAAALSGALMSSLCDFIARNLFSPLEIPLGAVTALLGAPLAVYLLTRSRNREQSA